MGQFYATTDTGTLASRDQLSASLRHAGFVGIRLYELPSELLAVVGTKPA